MKNENLNTKNRDEAISKLSRSIEMMMNDESVKASNKRTYPKIRIICNDYQKILQVAFEAVKQSAHKVDLYICQSGLISYPIDFILWQNKSLDVLENHFNLLWDPEGDPIASYGFEYWKISEDLEMERVSASELPENSILIVRDANALDRKSSQHSFVHHNRMVLFHWRDDAEFLRKNADPGTMNHFSHWYLD